MASSTYSDLAGEEMQLTNNEFVERIDALTGCANLLSFLETLSARLRSKTNSVFSLLLVDLNNFMAFNAKYGHATGELCAALGQHRLT